MVHKESVHKRIMRPSLIHRSFVNDCLSFSYPYSYKTAEIGRNLASLQIKLDLKTCECHFCFNERIEEHEGGETDGASICVLNKVS